MKPLHEETLKVVPESHGRYALVASDGTMVATTRAHGGPLIAQRLATGPALARALLATADYRRADDGLPCWCACREGPHVDTCLSARAVLREAGAL